jgi:hypothetical protein
MTKDTGIMFPAIEIDVGESVECNRCLMPKMTSDLSGFSGTAVPKPDL